MGKKIIIIVVSIILFVVLAYSLSHKIDVSNIKFSKVDYTLRIDDDTYDYYTYKVDLPQLKGNSESTTLFNASIFQTYNEFINSSIENSNIKYKKNENEINKHISANVIEQKDIIFVIIRMIYQNNKIARILYYDKEQDKEISNQEYQNKLLGNRKYEDKIKTIDMKDYEEFLNGMNIEEYIYIDKKGRINRIINYQYGGTSNILEIRE